MAGYQDYYNQAMGQPAQVPGAASAKTGEGGFNWDLLQDLSASLLASDDPFEGLGKGMMLYKQNQRQAKKEQDRRAHDMAVFQSNQDFQKAEAARSQGNTDRTFDFNKGEADRSQNRWQSTFDQSTDQFAQRMGLSRAQFASEQDYRAKALDLQNRQHDLSVAQADRSDFYNGQENSRQNAANDADIAWRKARTSNLMDENGNPTPYAYQVKKDEDAKGQMFSEADSGAKAADSLRLVQERLKKDPSTWGPSVTDQLYRSVAIGLGLEAAGDISAVRQQLAGAELQIAQGQKGLGQLTEMERTIIRKAIANPETMTPEEANTALTASIKLAEAPIARLKRFRGQPKEGALRPTDFLAQDFLDSRSQPENNPVSGMVPQPLRTGDTGQLGNGMTFKVIGTPQ